MRSLVRLCAHGPGSEVGWLPDGAANWRVLAGVCDAHQVTAYVYCQFGGAARANLPPEFLNHLRRRFQEICSHNHRLAAELVDISLRFQAAGVPVLTFKGPTLAMAIYGGLSSRQFADLDLIIHKEHHQKALALLRQWGYQSFPTVAVPWAEPFWGRPEAAGNVARTSSATFVAPHGTYCVDLHWHLAIPFWRALGPNIAKLWERCVDLELPQGRVTTLGREDLFLLLCAHGTRHRWRQLKWLVDVVEILRRPARLDWERIEAMVAVSPGAAASASVALLLARDSMEISIPAEAQRILPETARTRALAQAIGEELLLRRRVTASEGATLLELEARPLARLRYRLAWLVTFPVAMFWAAFVQVSPADRAFIPLPRRLEFLYHLVRPLRIALQYGVIAPFHFLVNRGRRRH